MYLATKHKLQHLALSQTRAGRFGSEASSVQHFNRHNCMLTAANICMLTQHAVLEPTILHNHGESSQ